MGFLFRNTAKEGEQSDYRTLVREAQDGDKEARERLIKRYSPFVLKVTSKVCKRFVRMGEDDEVSIGLMAFNEAIDCYDQTKQISFLSFAETVIRRRLLDYFRKEQNNSKTIPMSSFQQEDDENNDGTLYHVEAKKSKESFDQANLTAERKEEIIIYNQKLQEFGLSFAELVKVSPKHEDARVRAIEVAHLISSDPELREHLLRKKELPLKAIEDKVSISRKTLERQRKYIIAITVILVNDFTYLKQYVNKVG